MTHRQHIGPDDKARSPRWLPEAAWLLVFAAMRYAQHISGSMAGRVVDQQGMSIKGVR